MLHEIPHDAFAGRAGCRDGQDERPVPLAACKGDRVPDRAGDDVQLVDDRQRRIPALERARLTWQHNQRGVAVCPYKRLPNTWVRLASSGFGSTIPATCGSVIPACRASEATTTTSAPSTPSAYSPYAPSTAARLVLPLPLGIEIKPCLRRGPRAANSRPRMSRGRGRCLNGVRAPFPRVTVKYSRANASTRRSPERGRCARTSGGR